MISGIATIIIVLLVVFLDRQVKGFRKDIKMIFSNPFSAIAFIFLAIVLLIIIW